jgi:NADPH:quinone reductase-like Zn-dependent oxidoreductase
LIFHCLQSQLALVIQRARITVSSMQMFEAMGCAVAASGIKPVIDKIFPFDEAQAAYRHMASGAHLEKSLSQ